MPYYIFLALGAFLFTLLGTRLVILACRENRLLMDNPNPRSNHARPTPKGGGIAVVFALVSFLLAADASYWLIIGLTFLAAISLLDDMISLSPLTRLVAQVFVVLIVLQNTPLTLLGSMVPVWVDRLAVAIFWVWFINLFNFMDGIDGISAIEMISIGAGIYMVMAFDNSFGSQISVFGLILAAAASGFLWWNRAPAKIFLGDVGSIPIGFFIGYLLLSFMQQPDYAIPALILPAYYLADATYTMLSRIFRGAKPWQAHSEHFYQKAVRSGWSHQMTARTILELIFYWLLWPFFPLSTLTGHRLTW